MADIATSSLTRIDRTVQGNKRVHYVTYTPTTASGADTVNVALQRVEFATGNWAGTTAISTAGVTLNIAATTAGVVVTNSTHANVPVNIIAVGR